MARGPNASKEGLQRQRAATLSLVVGVLILAIKLVAAAITGSAAVFGDALESIVNVVSAVMVLLSVRWANTPADDNHPFGHGRIEAVSAGVEGALLLAAAFGIAFNAIPALFTPRELTSLELGLGLITVTMFVNFAVGRFLIRQGKGLNSMALTADGQHLIADALTTVAMLAGVGLVGLTGWLWLDPVVALGLAAWVAYSGVQVVRGAIRFLMNEQRPADVAALATALEDMQLPKQSDPHGLRILHGGRTRFVFFKIYAPSDWSLQRADELAERLERATAEAFEGDVRADVKVLPAAGGGIDDGELWRSDPESLTRA